MWNWKGDFNVSSVLCKLLVLSKNFSLHLLQSQNYLSSHNTFNWVIIIKLSKTHQELLDTVAGLYTSFFTRNISSLELHSAFKVQLKLHVTRIQIFRYSLLQFQQVVSKFFILNILFYLLCLRLPVAVTWQDIFVGNFVDYVQYFQDNARRGL